MEVNRFSKKLTRSYMDIIWVLMITENRTQLCLLLVVFIQYKYLYQQGYDKKKRYEDL